MTGRPGETFPELQAALRGRICSGDEARLEAAHAYAARVHAGQRRRSRDPYITHCLAVATILAGWGQSADVVIAGLLHDVLDGVPDLGEASRIAGNDVVALVAAVHAIDGASRQHVPTMSFSEGVATMSSFERQVLTIKLADRLHNARTWRFVEAGVARVKATETASVYAPVAGALGLAEACRELLDRSTAQLVDGGTQPARVLSRALGLLPPQERGRYLVEWTGDLAQLTSERERLAFAAGLVYSALVIRRHAAPPAFTL